MILNLQGYDINLPDPPKDKTLIYGWDKPKSEQFWERPYTLSNKAYEKLSPSQQSEIRRTETLRRVDGFWFFNNGVPTYLTGDAYFYFTHFTINGNHPQFIYHQAEDFYFYKYCEDDKYCDGCVEIKPRQEGCTSRKQALYLNQSMLSFHQHYGIQSKTADDAEKVNYDKLVISFDLLPKWMKPEVQSTSFPPHEELRFGKPRVTKKGDEDKEYLNTVIDWKATVFNAYDGKQLDKWIGDEAAKFAKGCLFDEAWKVVRPALKKKKGKAYILSTMGEIEGEGVESFRQLWRDSNPNERDGNGFTVSGLYRWFIPAWRQHFDKEMKGVKLLDKYGFINIELANQYIKNEYDAKKTEKDKFFFIRQNPANAEQALNYGAASNIFDTARFSERMNELKDFIPTEERPQKYLVGNLAWKNNIRFGEVVFNANPNGKFKIAFLPDIAGADARNKLYREENVVKPYGNTIFRMGIDPFSYDNKSGNGFSLGGFYIKSTNNLYQPKFSNKYCLEYLFREMLSEMFYEDVALAMFYYGCRVNFERSAYSKPLEGYMKRNGLNGFLMRRPDVTKNSKHTQSDNEYGTPASEENIASGIRYIQNNFAEPNPLLNENKVDHLKDFWFDEGLKQLLEYTIENKTRYDLVAAMINTEIACQPDKKVSAAAADQVKDMKNKVALYAFRNPPQQKPQTRQLVNQ